MNLCRSTPAKDPIPPHRKPKEKGKRWHCLAVSTAHCKQPDASKNLKESCPNRHTIGVLGKQQAAATNSLWGWGVPMGLGDLAALLGTAPSLGPSQGSGSPTSATCCSWGQARFLPKLIFFFFLWNWMENSTQRNQGKIQEKTPPVGKCQSVSRGSEMPKQNISVFPKLILLLRRKRLPIWQMGATVWILVPKKNTT